MKTEAIKAVSEATVKNIETISTEELANRLRRKPAAVKFWNALTSE